ncbi:hypothetical protein L596_007848 [Steinernema carpocapsae]|uniref:Uncharacterized protein n=1 Tax=Steinernema carpocapsae TaxID=34508 RepID=A0A4U5PAM2_STECR|nr:hypothetical protein L596_007848 [Steinernema carpocapsae]
MSTARSSASAVYRRIDMSHGLMQSIVRNQIDRDEYHKIMTEKTERVKREVETQRQAAAPRATNLYVPPHLRHAKGKDTSTCSESAGSSSGSSEAELSPDRLQMRRRIRERLEKQINKTVDGEIVPSFSSLSIGRKSKSQAKVALFNLSLKKEDGQTEDFVIYNTDNAARTSKFIGRRCGLSEEECRRLRLKIEAEQNSRMEK